MNWIACEDQMPKHHQQVVSFLFDTYLVVYYDEEDETWLCYYDDNFAVRKHEITHWLSLPEIPKH